MKGIIVVSRFWTKLFSFGKARGVTVFPFIFLFFKGDKNDIVLLNHERIHIRQALEMLVIPFYIWYFVEFLVRYCQFKNSNKTYHAISFEREAYQNEGKLDYLNKRAFWCFLNYLKIK